MKWFVRNDSSGLVIWSFDDLVRYVIVVCLNIKNGAKPVKSLNLYNTRKSQQINKHSSLPDPSTHLGSTV